MDFKAKLNDYKTLIENHIDGMLPPRDEKPSRIHEAMLYSMEAGGKRLRPMLVLIGSELFPSKTSPDAMPAAMAIECIHTYSLIHDDLPSVDNSDLRRGRPTCHKAFDEPTALLAGDALLTYAFQLISTHYLETPSIGIQLTQILSDASGSQRLIGGQMVDIESEGTSISNDELHFIHKNKTGALIQASLQMGLCLSQPSAEQEELIAKIGLSLGLAFQIIDDILDVTSTEEELGKDIGQDVENEKNTYISMHGMDASRKRAHELTEECISLCNELGGNNDFLIQLIKELEHRIS